MKLIDQSIQILDPNTPEEWIRQFKKIELAYRVCYKSEDRITDDSYKTFIPKFAKIGHQSPLEHFAITVKLICSRAIQQELTRHRLASYSVESTRYVNYSKKEGEMTFIKPAIWDKLPDTQHQIYIEHLESAETTYNRLVHLGAKPETARDVLPLALKSEMIMTANLREFLHIIKLRTSSAAHYDIRQLISLIKDQFMITMPWMFEN
jgi:thymidylate synthase (FAD)